MKAIDQWFDEYGESHRNPINKLTHWICVPLITFSVLGMLWAIHPWVAMLVVGGSLLFYAMLSWQIAAAMLVVSLVMLLILSMMTYVFWPSVAIFVLAWIGQFIGHHIEGKKPSFFKDVQFLLIGPAWLLGFVFRLFGVRY
ncbi:Mpo1-like protein [Halopseudomonas pachastrellae]|nr:Mpo1-like protein [Halopseudomonas pachastrellae]